MDATDTRALRDLITGYGALRAGKQVTAQARGQQFNTLIASVLRWWGIDAQVNARGHAGRDEINVVFAIGQSRFLLEAKWLKAPVSADPLAKLHDRIRSRASGTRGVLLSMSGYTKAALDAAANNKWPDVLLLDRGHFEAMLSGLTDPASLLTAVLDHASYHGGSYADLTSLLIDRQPCTPPTFTTVPPATLPWPVSQGTAAGVTIQVPLAGRGNWPEVTGMASGDDGKLLITVPDGVVEVSLDTGTTVWKLPLSGCRGTPAIEPDGGLLVTSGYAVVRWDNGTLDLVGGGFTGQSSLLAGPDNSTWVFDYSGLCALTRLGAHPGDEEYHEIDFPAHIWNAAWIGGRRFFLAASGHSAVIDLDLTSKVSRTAWIESPQPYPVGVLAASADTIITASRAGNGVRATLYRTHLTTRASDLMAELTLNDTGNLAPTKNGRVFLLADVRGNERAPHPILIQLTGALSA